MSCTLLDKLAPETRTLIYEYALTFDTPLKHVHKMRPFLDKPARSTESTESTESNAEMASDEEPSPASEYLNRVNTSVLTASKLIYKEAITVFYRHNTITIDATVCKPENIAKLRATDLSLATRATVKSGVQIDPEDRSILDLGPVVPFAHASFSKLFPKLKSTTVHVYTDAHPTPVTALLAIAAAARSSPIFASARFSGVGTVLAYPNYPPDGVQLTCVIQCKMTADRWAKGKLDHGLDDIDIMDMSMRTVHETWNGQGNSSGTNPIAYRFFSLMRAYIMPLGHPPFDMDSYEFWTVADVGLRLAQIERQREGLRLAQIERQREELARSALA